MANSTTLSLHAKHTISKVDPRIFGGFLEHMGRAVYDGVVDRDTAQPKPAVLDVLKPLQMPVMRWPGGNFVSDYHWENGIGPVTDRPVLRELAWDALEPNTFGTDEFLAMCKEMDWEPMMSCNLGTGTPEEARNWLEYCNAPVGSKYADMRAANGHPEPYGTKLWCLGNEMDGSWQIGHTPVEGYVARALNAALMMKRTDKSVEFVAAGTCVETLPTNVEWDMAVLKGLGDLADYLSVHRYVGNADDNTAEFLAVTNMVDRQIETMDAVCIAAAGRKRETKKRAYLCFDEWNIWYRSGYEIADAAPRWEVGCPRIEEVYNLEDVIVAAGFLNSFIRHADSVKIANIAQIVNVIAPVLTRGDEILIQSIYWPFEMMTKRREGDALAIQLDGPTFDGERNGPATIIDSSVILGDGVLHVFASNRSLDAEHELKIDLAGATIQSLRDGEIVTGTDPKAANSFENPNVVTKESFTAATIENGVATVTLPALSFTAMTFELA